MSDRGPTNAHLKRRVADLEREVDVLRQAMETPGRDNPIGPVGSLAAMQLMVRQLPVIIWSTDTELRIRYAAGTGFALMGVDAARHLGKTLYEVLGTDDPAFPTVAAHLKALRGESVDLLRESRGRVNQSRLEPLRLPDGNIGGVVGVAMDVTERTRAEEGDAYLAAIVESSDDAIVGKSLDGTITSWNQGAERMYGYTKEEAIGRPVAMLVPPDVPDEVPEILGRIRRGERIEQYETKRRRKDGRVIDVLLTISPIKNRDGQTIGGSKIARDITERKQQQERQDQAKVQFLSVLAHELRTPMTPLLTAAGMLQEVLSPAPGSIEGKLLANVFSGAQALRSRVDDLVDVSAFNAGVFRLSPAPLDPRALLDEACDFVRPEAAKKGLAVTLSMAPGLPRLHADRSRLFQVMTNLLVNAIKFSPDGGRILVQAEDRGGALRVEVKDQGKGISGPEQARLFEPYFRTEQDRHRFPGLGLGLTLANQIVRAHGGQMWVESELGRGSVFGFSVPSAVTSGAASDQRGGLR